MKPGNSGRDSIQRKSFSYKMYKLLSYGYILPHQSLYLQLKNAKYRNISYKRKKSQNAQVVHKNLHIFGSLIFIFIVLKHPLA
ncbi:hypothetical protein ACFPA1_22155 [Neobacillus sp. GCM10023253]|uniref:hypothetical protein n=1 Tax=Neobacillus sp. GCM10023253 TaxID=3252644 RepID=UPI00361190B0